MRALAAAPNDPDVLVNLCCCMTHLGKSDEFQQYYSKLEQVSPVHPFVVKTQSIITSKRAQTCAEALKRAKTSLMLWVFTTNGCTGLTCSNLL